MKPVSCSKTNILNGLKSTRKIFILAGLAFLISIKGSGQLTAEFYASSTNICSGSNVTFTDNSTGISGSTTYSWDFGVGASPDIATGKGPHIVNYTGSGINTIRLTITNEIVESNTKTITITVNAIPTIPEILVTDNCNGTSTLSTTSEGALLWSTMQTSPSIIVTEGGVYSVTTSINGCTSLTGSETATPKISPEKPVESVDCSLGYKEAVINIVSPLGPDFEYRLDGGRYQSGTSFQRVGNGSHTITVRNSFGCLTTGEYFEVSCGCDNAATVTLGSLNETTCNLNPITVTGNTFGGSASWVSITEDGEGSVSPSISFSSPFSYTYTPERNDAGKIVKITVTTNNPKGNTCVEAKETYLLNITSNPSIPEIGMVSQPSCTVPTGSVELNKLPEDGIWTLSSTSGVITIEGSGTSINIANLLTGSYYFTVTNDAGCVSESSNNIVIEAQPVIPAPPVFSTITHPSCAVSTGSVVLDGLPTGNWTINPGDIKGSNTSTSLSGLAPGTYNFTVTNSAGCISAPSGNIIINAQPLSPSNIIQAINCSQGFGKAVVTVSSPVGTDLEYSMDGGTYRSDNSFIDVNNGNHIITVRNSSGCITRGVEFSVSCICSNPPIITLSSPGGSTCGTSIVTVSNNIFGGSATTVILTSDGAGVVSPVSASASPFTFTYTPSESDSGKKVIISLTTNNPLGKPCGAETAIYTLSVNTKPEIPSVGLITHISCLELTGSVILSGLPSGGTWKLTRSPDSVDITGSGSSANISGLSAGTYNFTVTSANGCVSSLSKDIIVPVQPATVNVVITNPDPVCAPGRVNLTAQAITAGSSPDLKFTYFTDASAATAYQTPSAAGEGTYFIKGTDNSGCYDIKPVMVKISPMAIADAGPDKVLDSQSSTTMDAVLNSENDTGIWSLISGTGVFLNNRNAKTIVSKLSMNENIFVWKVTNGICPESYDTVIISVNEFQIKTLITPNMDGKNDYFVFKGLSSLGKTELIVFDRRGVQVYTNGNYDNSWNGIDLKGNQLQDDTYFYILKTKSGRSVKGFIVIRR